MWAPAVPPWRPANRTAEARGLPAAPGSAADHPYTHRTRPRAGEQTRDRDMEFMHVPVSQTALVLRGPGWGRLPLCLPGGQLCASYLGDGQSDCALQGSSSVTPATQSERQGPSHGWLRRGFHQPEIPESDAWGLRTCQSGPRTRSDASHPPGQLASPGTPSDPERKPHCPFLPCSWKSPWPGQVKGERLW